MLRPARPLTCLLPCRADKIPASEFAERFFGIFSATPRAIRHELFVQMALLIPSAPKRLELLQQAVHVSVSCYVGVFSQRYADAHLLHIHVI